MKLLRCLFGAALALSSVNALFGATITEVLDKNAWTTAINSAPTFTQNFNAYNNSYSCSTTAAGLNFGAVTFSGPQGGGNYFVCIEGITMQSYWSDAVLMGPAQYLLVVLNQSANAVGFDLMSAGAATTTVDFGGGNTFTLNTSTARQFFGVTSPDPITSFTISTPTVQTALDNFQLGTANVTPVDSQAPEASTMFLIGSGLLALKPLRRLSLLRLRK